MIKDLGELEKFFKLCRKQGVKDIKLGDVTVTFGDLARKPRKGDEGDDETPTDELSPEQMMFFSAGGAPPP